MEFTVRPIGFVRNSRSEMLDDHWGGIVSEIHLAEDISIESLSGMEAFSHLEILFVFDKVDPLKIVYTATYPRGNAAYPKTGIFAQRKKNRPNRIGATIVELIKVEGNALTVRNLDAIDETPVIDIKPVMKEFLPQTAIRQPEWSHELMKNYWL
jgi:tRNA-Thr(GGU) m(6)t(6)A37 methyltransferase TsaA